MESIIEEDEDKIQAVVGSERIQDFLQKYKVNLLAGHAGVEDEVHYYHQQLTTFILSLNASYKSAFVILMCR